MSVRPWVMSVTLRLTSSASSEVSFLLPGRSMHSNALSMIMDDDL